MNTVLYQQSETAVMRLQVYEALVLAYSLVKIDCKRKLRTGALDGLKYRAL